MFLQNSEKLIFKRKWCTKQSEKSEKRPKEVKKREKQTTHEKIGQL
jgi:hypothetical protein